jgi:hypothetical protein
MKQYKARIEIPNAINFHAIEAWMQADNIIEAGKLVMEYFGCLGITTDHVTKLNEMENHAQDNPDASPDGSKPRAYEHIHGPGEYPAGQ